jgi:hypothetical protein
VGQFLMAKVGQILVAIDRQSLRAAPAEAPAGAALHRGALALRCDRSGMSGIARPRGRDLPRRAVLDGHATVRIGAAS